MSQRTKKHRRVHSANSTNLTSVVTAATPVYCLFMGNSGGTHAFLKLYDKATAPVLASDTPFATILIPANLTVDVEIDAFFTNGIAYAITGGAGDTDTVAVAAGQVSGLIIHG